LNSEDAKKRDLNIQHRTTKGCALVNNWMLGVGCWLLDVPVPDITRQVDGTSSRNRSGSAPLRRPNNSYATCFNSRSGYPIILASLFSAIDSASPCGIGGHTVKDRMDELLQQRQTIKAFR
jgi:hypothetical protein